jgi:hypothetical protein
MTTFNFANLYGFVVKSMDDYIYFQRFYFISKRFILGGISLTNKHMFILDGHGSHVTFEAIEQTQTFRLDMVTYLHIHGQVHPWVV